MTSALRVLLRPGLPVDVDHVSMGGRGRRAAQPADHLAAVQPALPQQGQSRTTTGSARRLDDQHSAACACWPRRSKHHGNDAVGRLYTALGTLIHHDDDEHLTRLADAIAAAGLPAELIEPDRDDDSWDAFIEESTERGRAIVGKDAGIPIVVIDDAETHLLRPGPVTGPDRRRRAEAVGRVRRARQHRRRLRDQARPRRRPAARRLVRRSG